METISIIGVVVAVVLFIRMMFLERQPIQAAVIGSLSVSILILVSIYEHLGTIVTPYSLSLLILWGITYWFTKTVTA